LFPFRQATADAAVVQHCERAVGGALIRSDEREDGMLETYVGTSTGVYRIAGSGLEPLGLEGERVSALHAWRDDDRTTILAGTYENGLRRASRGENGGGDGGPLTWARVEDGLSPVCFRCIQPDPLEPGALLAGTEPARLFRSRDGGQSWHELDGIIRIEAHESWFLPYSPRAGAVRNVSAQTGSGDRLLASVEVGGLLCSDDRGASWAIEPVIEDDDIHFVTSHPTEPEVLYAALGYASLARRPRQADGSAPLGGVARSRDGGLSWTKLETDYTRAVLVPPADPDTVLAAPAPEVGRGGRIVVSSDGGDTWHPAADGIETPMPDMVELFVSAPDGNVWAVCSGGRLLSAMPGEWRWQPAPTVAAGLKAESVAFVES
jgi:hypothetical protein